jgi:hypothetical protein
MVKDLQEGCCHHERHRLIVVVGLLLLQYLLRRKQANSLLKDAPRFVVTPTCGA